MAQKSKEGGVVIKVLLADEPPAVLVPTIPLYSREGVLLNPAECVVNAEGIIQAKEG